MPICILLLRQTQHVLLWILFAFFMQSCAQLPKQPIVQVHTANFSHFTRLQAINDFQLHGRMALQHAGEGFSGKINWLHEPTKDSIDLFSPFGSQVAKLEKVNQQMTFIDDIGHRTVAQDEKSLMQNQLGWYIPIEALVDWSLGRSHLINDKEMSKTVFEANHLQFDEQGRLQTFIQDGWKIEYHDYQTTQGYDLPSKLTLRKDDLYLKLIIESWEIHSPSQH